MKEKLQAAYLDYFNNYLTVQAFATDNEITLDQAMMLIELGRSIHESIVEEKK